MAGLAPASFFAGYGTISDASEEMKFCSLLQMPEREPFIDCAEITSFSRSRLVSK